jgi:cell division protein FtsB
MLIFILFAMFCFLLVIVLGDNGYMELTRLRGTLQDLKHTQASLTQENLQLYRTIDRLKNDPVYVENVARRELGMIRSDEVIFTFKRPAKAQ